jgi:hypothetical protein
MVPIIWACPAVWRSSDGEKELDWKTKFREVVQRSHLPRAGTAHQASNGFMVERDSKDTSLLSMPGKCKPTAWTRYPVVASMAIRECFTSDARNHAKVESDPKVANSRGSQGPTGLVDPGKSPRATERATELDCLINRKRPISTTKWTDPKS